MLDTMYDFGEEFAQTYKEKCKECGRVTEVSTQRDNHPEYYADVVVRCTCGASVLFNLPVN